MSLVRRDINGPSSTPFIGGLGVSMLQVGRNMHRVHRSAGASLGRRLLSANFSCLFRAVDVEIVFLRQLFVLLGGCRWFSKIRPMHGALAATAAFLCTMVLGYATASSSWRTSLRNVQPLLLVCSYRQHKGKKTVKSYAQQQRLSLSLTPVDT